MEGNSNKHSFVYNVEILIEDKNHQLALIQLLKKLNNMDVVDYKINSGIQLGNEIQSRRQKSDVQQSVPVSSEPLKAVAKKESKKPSATTTIASTLGLDQLQSYKDKNQLIRLIVNRGLGVKLSIPCRVLNIDEKDLIISVYHVDEKQVYTFRLIEIEDIIE